MAIHGIHSGSLHKRHLHTHTIKHWIHDPRLMMGLLIAFFVIVAILAVLFARSGATTEVNPTPFYGPYWPFGM